MATFKPYIASTRLKSGLQNATTAAQNAASNARESVLNGTATTNPNSGTSRSTVRSPIGAARESWDDTYAVDPNAWVTGDTPDWWGGSEANNLYDSTLNSYADDQSRQSLNSLRAAFSQNRADLMAQKPTIQQEAQEMRNSADTDYYTNDLQQLRRAMEAGGQRGGENITGMVSANATRGQRMGNADLYEANQLRNIDNAVSNLGSQESQALAEAQMGINSEVLANRLSGIRDAVSRAQTQRETEKADYLNTIGAYSDDFMQEINNLRAQGVPDTNYRIKALLDARNQKVASQQASGTNSLSNLSADDVRSLYKSGLLDYQTAQQLLQRLGVII